MVTKHTTTTTTKAASVPSAPAVPAVAPTAQGATLALGARATRVACSVASHNLYQQAVATGVLPGAVLLRMGKPWQRRGGNPAGLRNSMVQAAQAALANGPITWGTLQQVQFTYTNMQGTSKTGLVRAHLPFLLGNGLVLM